MIQTIDEDDVTILDFINQSIVILHNWKIVYFNFCFIEKAGVDSENLYNSDFFNFVHKKDKTNVERYLTNVVASYGSCSTDLVYFTFNQEDHKEFKIEMNGKRIYFKNKDCILCSLNDITIRSTKTRKLKRILDAIPEIVIVFDKKHTQIRSVNNSAEGLYGIPSEQFESNIFHPIDLVIDKDYKRVHDFYNNIIFREFDRIEYRIVTTSGEIKWVRDEAEVVYKEHGHGEILEVYHFIKDITERKKDEEIIQISEKKYRRIFENSTDPIFVINNEGRIIDINRVAVRLFCFSNKEEAISVNFNEYYASEEDREKLFSLIEKNGSVTDYPIQMRTRRDNCIDATITAGCRKNSESGHVESYQVIVHDVSFIIQKTELETYRRTLGGVADRVNNITQSQIMQFGLIEDYIDAYNAAEDDALKNRIAQKMIESIMDSKKIVSDLRELGAAVRKIYHKPEPPCPVSDGTGGILFDLKFR